jgi:hypothetical protein
MTRLPTISKLGGKKRRVQTASAVLCYSRMLFFQCYPTFRRFDCKVFLTDALRYTGGAPARVMIDNTHVVVLRGSGREMVPVPEMAAFAERFGFQFVAHAIGNAAPRLLCRHRSNKPRFPAPPAPVRLPPLSSGIAMPANAQRRQWRRPSAQPGRSSMLTVRCGSIQKRLSADIPP